MEKKAKKQDKPKKLSSVQRILVEIREDPEAREQAKKLLATC